MRIQVILEVYLQENLMTEKEFKKYLARDGHCYHCGTTDETLIPQHRRNRGMGGSVSRSRPSNLIVLCSLFNGAIEAVTEASVTAQRYGWKLRQGQEPTDTPVFDSWSGTWYLLDDNFGKMEIPPPLGE